MAAGRHRQDSVSVGSLVNWALVGLFVVILVWTSTNLATATWEKHAPPKPLMTVDPPAPEPVFVTPKPVPTDTTPIPKAKPVVYKSCSDAQKKGALPLLEGQPGYRKGLDSNRNGVACENYY